MLAIIVLLPRCMDRDEITVSNGAHWCFGLGLGKDLDVVLDFEAYTHYQRSVELYMTGGTIRNPR